MDMNDYLCFLIQVVQGSPVFCLFGNHWELADLVTESSVSYNDPVIVIKTVPYLSWIVFNTNFHSTPQNTC